MTDLATELGLLPRRRATGSRLPAERCLAPLLESTVIGIDQIATACGFADAVTLRKHLLAETGLNPTAYRRMYTTAPPA